MSRRATIKVIIDLPFDVTYENFRQYVEEVINSHCGPFEAQHCDIAGDPLFNLRDCILEVK